VLAEYQGTILLVSHDRYLIDALATQVWEIDEAERSLVVFKGTYSEYHAQKEAAREAERQQAEAPSQRAAHPGQPGWAPGRPGAPPPGKAQRG
jgi:ATP-binding cassette, subfamily F, member 3